MFTYRKEVMATSSLAGTYPITESLVYSNILVQCHRRHKILGSQIYAISEDTFNNTTN